MQDTNGTNPYNKVISQFKDRLWEQEFYVQFCFGIYSCQGVLRSRIVRQIFVISFQKALSMNPNPMKLRNTAGIFLIALFTFPYLPPVG